MIFEDIRGKVARSAGAHVRQQARIDSAPGPASDQGSGSPTWVTKTSKRRRRRWPLLVSAAVGLVLLGGIGGYVVWKVAGNHKLTDEERTAQTIEAVGKLFLLPTGEQPTVAEVADGNKLKAQQEFFAKAQTGDLVLVYKEAKLAILYRPSAKRLVNVSTVTLQNSADQQNTNQQDNTSQ